MKTKHVSLLGVVLGVIAGALVAIISGSWMFWLALGVALGVLLGSANWKRELLSRDRPNFGHGAGI